MSLLKTPGSKLRRSLKISLPQTSSVEPPPVLQRKKLLYHLHGLRPKGFQVGVAGAWEYPFVEDLDRPAGYYFGLHGNLLFSPNLCLWVSAGYSQVRFESNRMDPNIGIPVVMPPTTDFAFIKAELPRPSLQYSIGLQYLFQTRNRFKPFIGVGLGAAFTLPYEVVYDFRDETPEVEWVFEQRVDIRANQPYIAHFRAGTEFLFSKFWSAQLYAAYRHNLKYTTHQPPPVFGLQGALLYRFGK